MCSKEFAAPENTIYVGKVMGVIPAGDDGQIFYKVKYEDSDEEEMLVRSLMLEKCW